MNGPRVRVEPTQVVLDTTPLRTRHWFALGGILLLALGGWYAGADRISTALATVRVRAYLQDRRDDAGHVYSLLASGDAHRAALVIVGTSVSQASMWRDERLSREAGVPVTNLSTAGQTPMQSLFVLHAADIRPGQLVIVMTNPGQWTRLGQDDARLTSGQFGRFVPFASEFRGELPGMERWLAPRARNSAERAFQRQWLHRSIYGLLRRWSAEHLYGDTRPAHDQHRQNPGIEDGDPAAIANSRQIIQGRLTATFERNREASARILDVLVRLVQRRGGRVILLDSPRIAGDTTTTYGEWWARFRAEERALSDAHGVPIVDMNDAVGLQPAEMRDAYHVAAVGRDRWSSAFVARVREWCAATGDSPGCR